MKKHFCLIVFGLLLALYVKSGQFGQFISYHVHFHTALLDNSHYGIKTTPNKIHLGGGAGFSASINDQFNLLMGLNYMNVAPNNTRSDYSFCDDAFESCYPDVRSNQLFLPLGFEYYSNTERSPFQSFYSVSLVPSFSLTENWVVTPYDKLNVQQESYEIKNDGFKFQDLHLQIAINNEFSLSENYKIFIEPSMRHTILFRAEDVVNPDYMISIKVGFKFRGERGS